MVLTSVRISANRGLLGLSAGISRRDFRWGMALLFVGIAIEATLPDPGRYDRVAKEQSAEWTVLAVGGE
jgi:hypothetical protein